MPKGRRKVLVLGAVFCGGLLAGIALVLFFQARPQPVPDTSDLEEVPVEAFDSWHCLFCAVYLV